MTREEFDAELDVDTATTLAATLTKYRVLANMAEKFQRADLAAILGSVAEAVHLALAQAEKIGRPAAAEAS